ncbi:MAG: TonB-dependent receptor [Burkholderiales bacterium]|nr:TonB-dependent receptor [Burkholderiales bacterium]
MKRNPIKMLSWLVLLVYGTGVWAAESSEEEELALVYGDKSFVSIATGARQPVSRAPAVATVITAEEIAASGATDLDQILETVPGLHVSFSSTGAATNYTIRGVSSSFNPQVLMLINGIPRTSVFVGNRGDSWFGMPVEDIARIEIVRGPGSALYGADAFAGVINIVTKTASDINGVQLNARGGSFRSRDAWLLLGKTLGSVDVAGYLRAGRTDGYDATIAADNQTALDRAFGTHASFAPGKMNNRVKSVDGQIELSWMHWKWRADYKKRTDASLPFGVVDALDPIGHTNAQTYTSDLTYQDNTLWKDWDVGVQASYYHYDAESNLVIFPPGAFGGLYPNGMIGNPAKWERHGRIGATAVYSGWADHRWRLGVGHETSSIYKVTESKNFNFVFLPSINGYFPAPLGSVVDVSDTNPYLRPHSRQLSFVYAQDEWNFAKDWYLTGGVRHDRYSDFGGTTNPRLALVWEAAYNLTAKLLYGRAFRAPSFTELYAINNPALIGNPNAKPEKMETVEAALAWQPTGGVQLGINVFRYKMRDILRAVAAANPIYGSTVQNSGEQTGHGLELEASWDVSKTVRLSGNYAYQKATDQTTTNDLGNAPHKQLYLRGDWRFMADWSLSGQVKWIADRERLANDPRPPIADYHTVDSTLRYGSDQSRWDVKLSVHNMFNADAREPEPTGAIPGDIPLAGRSWWLTAGYRF